MFTAAKSFQSVWETSGKNFIIFLSQRLPTSPFANGVSLNLSTISHIICSKNNLTAQYRKAIFVKNWEKLTSEATVLDIVKGYEIPVPPKQLASPKSNHLSKKEVELVQHEVQEMLRKGTIAVTSSTEGQYLSSLFLVTKKDGENRPLWTWKSWTRVYFINIWKWRDYFCQRGGWPSQNALAIMPDFSGRVCFTSFAACFELPSAPRIFSKLSKSSIFLLRINEDLLTARDTLIVLLQHLQQSPGCVLLKKRS